MEKNMKRKWETPLLISIYRAQPEEAVLAGCKSLSELSGGPTGNLFGGCRYEWPLGDCYQIVSS